jgi:hypothetical protein
LKQKEGGSMKAISELRNGERFNFQAPVFVEDKRTGFRYDGTMFNYSRGGMYLETNYAPRPSRKLTVKVKNLPGSPAPRRLPSEVRWRQPLPGSKSGYSFGLGVKHF